MLPIQDFKKFNKLQADGCAWNVKNIKKTCISWLQESMSCL